MRRLIFDPEHEQFRDTVRHFMETEVGPHAEEWREAGMVDREVYRKAGANGLLCTWADERYGGAGIDDFRFEQIIIEENMRHGDIGFYINLHNDLVAPYIAKLGNAEQKDRLMPGIVSGEKILAVAMTEPSTGSDLAGMKTHAVERGDHWVLNGAKTYISNGILADVVVVAARTDPTRSHGMSLFLVERGMEGFERGRKLAKMGLKSQDTAELFFNDVAVPQDNLLGEAGQGFGYLARFLAQERLVAAIGFMATAQTAFDLTLDYVKERRAFGRPIGAMQNTRFVMADLRAKLDMAQTYVDQLVLLLNDGTLTAADASAAKLVASEVEAEVMDTCVQLHGGAGYMDEYRISRMFTDARISRIFAGTSEIMKEIIGRSIGLDEKDELMRTLDGKVALVSGSGRGIGRAVAIKLASQGARLVVNDLDEDVARDAVLAVEQAGSEAVACAGDVTAPDFGTRFIHTAMESFGPPDIIVNNAGYGWNSILQKTTDEQWEAMMAVHLTAPFRILRAAQPIIAAAARAEAGRGEPMGRRSVVNISSVAGIGGNAGQAGYASGKAGIIGLTRTAAKEWGRYNVTVNAVAFGIIGTRMTMPAAGEEMIDVGGRAIRTGMGTELKAGLAGAIPLGRPGTPEDAAGAVYLLCLPEAGYISGEVIVCGGGYRL